VAADPESAMAHCMLARCVILGLAKEGLRDRTAAAPDGRRDRGGAARPRGGDRRIDAVVAPGAGGNRVAGARRPPGLGTAAAAAAEHAAARPGRLRSGELVSSGLLLVVTLLVVATTFLPASAVRWVGGFLAVVAGLMISTAQLLGVLGLAGMVGRAGRRAVSRGSR
jgi:hypothetical protein